MRTTCGERLAPRERSFSWVLGSLLLFLGTPGTVSGHTTPGGDLSPHRTVVTDTATNLVVTWDWHDLSGSDGTFTTPNGHWSASVTIVAPGSGGATWGIAGAAKHLTHPDDGDEAPTVTLAFGSPTPIGVDIGDFGNDIGGPHVLVEDHPSVGHLDAGRLKIRRQMSVPSSSEVKIRANHIDGKDSPGLDTTGLAIVAVALLLAGFVAMGGRGRGVVS